jgi:hypothetical protein
MVKIKIKMPCWSKIAVIFITIYAAMFYVVTRGGVTGLPDGVKVFPAN